MALTSAGSLHAPRRSALLMDWRFLWKDPSGPGVNDVQVGKFGCNRTRSGFGFAPVERTPATLSLEVSRCRRRTLPIGLSSGARSSSLSTLAERRRTLPASSSPPSGRSVTGSPKPTARMGGRPPQAMTHPPDRDHRPGWPPSVSRELEGRGWCASPSVCGATGFAGAGLRTSMNIPAAAIIRAMTRQKRSHHAQLPTLVTGGTDHASA